MTERPGAQQPAASAQKDLFNRDWAAMFDEEVIHAHKDELFRAAQREVAARRQQAVMQAENGPPHRLCRPPGTGRG